MTTLYDAFGTDADLEANGAWVDWGDLGKFKIAAWMNKHHQDVLARLRKPYRSFELSGRDLPSDKAEAIGIQAMAEAVLIDWSGVKGKDGAELGYSIPAAIELLTDLKRFRNQVVAVATEAETYRRQALASAVGN